MEIIAQLVETTDFADDTNALTIAAAAALCGGLLALLAAATTPEWGGRLGFIALAVSSLGASFGFGRISTDINPGLWTVSGVGGAFLILCLLAVYNRLRGRPGGEDAR